MSNRIETALPVPSAISERREQSPAASTMQEVKNQLERAKRLATQQIVERPVTSLVVAAMAGLALGWMLKRK